LTAVLTTRLKLLSKQKFDYSLDAISISLIATNILLSVYLVTVAVNIQAYDVALKSVLMVLLTIIGLVMFIVTSRKIPSMDNTLTPKELSEITGASIIGFILVLILQTAVIHAYPLIYADITDVTTLKLLLTNVAIGEEIFFTFFLQSAITNSLTFVYSNQTAITGGILGKSVIFSIYHYVYYRMPEVVLAVFVSSLVLGAVYAITRRPSVTMLIHILVNLT